MLADRYELLQELGSGGMSVVYKAMDMQMNRVVAVKMLKAATLAGSEKSALRLQQEAKALSVLKHENILEIYSMGVTPEGIPFLVTELIEGKTLSALIDNGKIELPLALSLFVQICSGLIEAHEKGIVHRDLKPSNVMVLDTGPIANADIGQRQEDSRRAMHVKIMDFGVSKVLNLEPNALRLTQTGAMIGSPLYMSPEQVTGKPVDARSDIYSMGCLMFEVLTGKPPFEADSLMGSMQKKLSESFSELATQLFVPKELQTIIEKCLHADPEKRFQSAADLAAAINAAPTSGPVKKKKPASRRPAITKTLKLVGIVSLLTIAAGIAVFSGISYMEKSKQIENKELAELSHKHAQAAMHTKKYDEAVNLINQAIALEPTNSSYYLLRGMARLAIKQDEQHRALADADLDKAIEIDPRNFEALRQKSLLVASRGKLEAALNMINQSLKVNDHLDGRMVRAEYLSDLQLNNEALKELNYLVAHETSLDRQYNLMKAIVARSRAFIDLDRLPEARVDLERSSNYKAHFPNRYFHQSFLHIKEKRYDEALKDIEQVLLFEPLYSTELLNQSRALSWAGKAQVENNPSRKKNFVRKAKYYFDDAANTKRLEVSLHRNRAAFYVANDLQDELKTEIEKLTTEKQYTQAAIRAQSLGEAYSSLKKYTTAAPFFHKALKLYKSEMTEHKAHHRSTWLMRGRAYLGLGNCDFHKGRVANALKYYKKALEANETYCGKKSADNLAVLEPYKTALEAAHDPLAKEITQKIQSIKELKI